MAQEKKIDTKSSSMSSDSKVKKADDKLKDRRGKETPPTKVVIRRLPPSLTSEQFLEVISPVAEHDYYKYHKSDPTLGSGATARAYINFINQEDLIEFTETFDGYVFVDSKGGEHSAVVEFAPFQKVPKKKPKKADSKKGTIEEDNDYKRFLDQLENPDSETTATPEAYLEEIEQREREKENKGSKQSTPLLDYIKRKKDDRRAALLRKPYFKAMIEYDLDYVRDKIKAEEKARDERKRKEIERRKQREDERRKRRDKERDRGRDKDRDRDRERKDSDGAPQFKLLKNPDRDNDKDSGNRNHSNSSDRKDDRSNRAKSWKEREAERKRERERERSGKKERDGDKRFYDDDERVPSYARKDDKRDDQRKNDRRDDRRDEKEPPSKATKEKYKEYKDNVKGMSRRYESGRVNRDKKDDKETKEPKKEPELRFSKKAREREKELKREREGNGKGRSDRDRGDRERHNDRENKGSQEKFKDGNEDGREETASEKRERTRKERIRNKDRPERAIYVPGAARRAQQQKGSSRAESGSPDTRGQPGRIERTDSPRDSNDSEEPPNERLKDVKDVTPPNETEQSANLVDMDKVESGTDFSRDKDSSPEEGDIVKPGVSETIKPEVAETVVSDEVVKEDES